MKLIIAGTRTFEDYGLLSEAMFNHFSGKKIEVIISGGAKGTDELGKVWGNAHNIPVVEFKPDWENYGKAAGPMRNRLMASKATDCLVFWDGKSKGTKSMINEAKQKELNLIIIKY